MFGIINGFITIAFIATIIIFGIQGIPLNLETNSRIGTTIGITIFLMITGIAIAAMLGY